MKRFTCDLYSKNDDFPVNTYVTNHTDELLNCLKKLFDNDISGISKVVILDSNKKMFIGMNPYDLDLPQSSF